MTERPTEQTQPRLTGLDAPAEAGSDYRAAAPQAPTLPPMPRQDADGDPGRTPLAERLQQKLSAVRQAASAGPPVETEAPTEQTTVRPAVREPAATSAPVLPPPPADLQPAAQQPVAQQPAAPARPAKTRTPRSARVKRPPRRARLRLTRIDPWSVMKTAFLLSIALGVVTIVSVLMVWSVLGAAGVWDSINTAVRDIVGDQSSTPFSIQDYLGTNRVIGFTMLVAVIDVVLLTAIATLAAFLYNMAAALLGGIDITLVEDEH